MKYKIGYLPQFNPSFGKLSVEENLQTICHLYKIENHKINYLVNSILDELSLLKVRKNIFESLQIHRVQCLTNVVR